MNIYSAITSNVRKTYLIMFLFVILITTLVYVFVKATGYSSSYAVIALVIATFSSVGSYFFSDKIVLATSHAQPVDREHAPEVYNTLENLSIGAGMPMPKLYLIHDPVPNAFATGRDPGHAVVAVTTGLVEKLNKVELEGVLAHELSHIKNFDTRLMMITAVLVGFIAILSELFMRHLFFRGSDRNSRAGLFFLVIGIVLALLTPLVASLIQLAVSRKREFLADASGALLTRYPDGLAQALEKIASDPHPNREATNATAHLFIINPFKGKSAGHWFAGLFNTHPPIEERIKILREM
jgi:heat shock protein HtpX